MTKNFFLLPRHAPSFTFSFYFVLRLLPRQRTLCCLETWGRPICCTCLLLSISMRQKARRTWGEGGRGVRASGVSLREAAQVQVLNLKLIAQQILAKFRFHCAPKICLCLIRGNFLLFFWFFFLFHLLLLPRFRLFLLLRVVFLVLLCEFVL